MLEQKAPPARNGPNTGSLAPGVRKRVNKKVMKNNLLLKLIIQSLSYEKQDQLSRLAWIGTQSLHYILRPSFNIDLLPLILKYNAHKVTHTVIYTQTMENNFQIK